MASSPSAMLTCSGLMSATAAAAAAAAATAAGVVDGLMYITLLWMLYNVECRVHQLSHALIRLCSAFSLQTLHDLSSTLSTAAFCKISNTPLTAHFT